MTTEPKMPPLPILLANRLKEGITTGHDWPNSNDELLRLQAASELRRLHDRVAELERVLVKGQEVSPMSTSNRLVAYRAAEKLRSLGYVWDDVDESWVATTPPTQPAQDESAGSNAQQQSDAELQPAREWIVITEGTAAAYLHDLCEALNNAFISTWQSTHAWEKQLDAANEYLREKNAGQPVVKKS